MSSEKDTVIFATQLIEYAFVGVFKGGGSLRCSL